MTYDLHGSWDGYTGENSPLYKLPTETGSNAYLNVVRPTEIHTGEGCRKSGSRLVQVQKQIYLGKYLKFSDHISFTVI